MQPHIASEFSCQIRSLSKQWSTGKKKKSPLPEQCNYISAIIGNVSHRGVMSDKGDTPLTTDGWLNLLMTLAGQVAF
jgi:hypothetical protein